MHVARDLLDREVVDRNGREMGRVDGVLLDVQDGKPPQLAAILIGPSALGYRLQPGLGRLVRRIERWWRLGENRPAQIGFSDVVEIGRRVRLRLAVGDTDVDALERRLRDWIAWLPG